MVGLPDGEKSLRIYIRRTDRQTSCYGIVRAMHTRRAVTNNSCEYVRGECFRGDAGPWPGDIPVNRFMKKSVI